MACIMLQRRQQTREKLVVAIVRQDTAQSQSSGINRRCHAPCCSSCALVGMSSSGSPASACSAATAAPMSANVLQNHWGQSAGLSPKRLHTISDFRSADMGAMS